MAVRLMGPISVNSLPSLIAEIDARRYRPTPGKQDEIIARYRERELRSRQEPFAAIVANMINEHLIGVLWLTRKYRKPENKGKTWQN